MSLYLKYRPQDFKNLQGQTFVKETLQKALSQDKTVGAYLLCGPRGTGKTTTARLLAKTMNCLKQKDGNPCLKCTICKDFIEEKLVDIIEIDAASNTGVDNIRSLIERAQFRPTATKYKVYIIDEVHMLSKGAFNALLKILEEPPEFVKFILATTETHKVPETIISRCQRYDFRRISKEDIEERLNYITKEENIKIDDKSMEYIVKNSGGGLRNAISLLEQLNSNGKIKYDDLIKNLGISPNSQYKKFLKELLENDKNVINSLEEINSSGKNTKLFFKGLIFYTKDSILKDIKKSKSVVTKLKVLEILDETYTRTKNSLDEDITFLVGVLNIINREEISRQENNIGEITNLPQEKVIRKENEVPKIIIKPKIEKKKEEITSSDAEDIFGNTEKPNTTSTKKEEVTKSENNSFDKKVFLNLVKKAGGTSGLKLSLLGTNINFEDNNCIIHFKTPFALKGANTNENLAYIASAISEMGYIGTQVILK